MDQTTTAIHRLLGDTFEMFVRHNIWGAFTGGVLCRLFGTTVAGPFTGGVLCRLFGTSVAGPFTCDVLCRLFGTSVATLALGQSPVSRAGTTSTNSSP